MLAPIHEHIRIELPNGYLTGDLSYAQTPGDFAVVWVHGFGSVRGGEKAQALEAACSRRRWTFAAFDFRGHGQSSGVIRDLRAATLLGDLDAIRTFLASRGIRRIGLVGSSMGGFAAAWFALKAGREAVPACVLLAPGFRFLENRWNQLSPVEREAWKSTGVLAIQNEWVTAELDYGLVLERDHFRSDVLSARWDRPALLFHGLDDQVVSWQQSLEFVERTKGQPVEIRLFAGGDHRLSAYKDEIAEESCRFLERHIA